MQGKSPLVQLIAGGKRLYGVVPPYFRAYVPIIRNHVCGRGFTMYSGGDLLTGLRDGIEALAGVKLSVLLAGLMGGIVAGIIDKGPLWERSISVIVGFICSLYLTPFAVTVLSGVVSVDPDNLQNGAAFFVGMTGLVITRAALDYVRDIFKNLPFNKPRK
jgi:hypothetical protein